MTRVVVPAPISCYVFIEQSDPMLPRLILIPLLTLITAASAAGAWAQDKGTVNPKPLPPLANPNDPNVGAKELFGRKVLPAAMPTRVLGFYAHACPGLLAHLREDGARHQTAAKGNLFKLQTASESSATIEPSKSASWAAPSAAHPSKR